MPKKKMPLKIPELKEMPATIEDFLDVVYSQVDTDLLNILWVNTGEIKSLGDAVELLPELSSENPSRIWSRAQLDMMTLKVANNQEALFATEELLSPIAEEELDYQQSVLSGKKECQWPVRLMAAEHVRWCKDHVTALEALKDAFDFKGYPVWEAGEIANGIYWKRIPLDTKYIEGLPKAIYFQGNPDAPEDPVDPVLGY